jgi:hypothetical protein
LCANPIAFFYCSKNSSAEPDRARPLGVLKAILRQLASSDANNPVKAPVLIEYKVRQEMAEEDGSPLRALTIDDCTRLILELTKDNPATIIIDAFDECDEESRYKLLDALDLIMASSKEVVRVFVSSRDDIDIVSWQICASADFHNH